jgi:hypothetical protein
VVLEQHGHVVAAERHQVRVAGQGQPGDEVQGVFVG